MTEDDYDEREYTDIVLQQRSDGSWVLRYKNLNGVPDGLSLDSEDEEDAEWEARSALDLPDDYEFEKEYD